MSNCSGVATTVTTVASADITADAAWSGTVFVTRPVNVQNGATLIIAPGTQLVMGADTYLAVGDKISGGALKAAGTSAQPISFCGKQAQNGYWGGVALGRYARTDSVLSSVTLSDGGGGDTALLLAASAHLTDVTVRGALHDGVWAAAFSNDSARLSIQNCGRTAAILLSSEAVNAFPLGGTYSGNAESFLRVRFGTVESETHFRNVGLPYLDETGKQLRAGAKLVYEAGVTVRFAADTAVTVGLDSNAGELAVLGTLDNPVIFAGASSAPGYWQGVALGGHALTSSRLEHLRLRDAGGKQAAALYLDAAITLVDVALTGNATGMSLGAAGLHAGSTALSITGTQGPPLTLAPDALVSLPAGSSFTGNAQDYIVIEGGHYEAQGTVGNFGVPYLVSGSISLQNAAMMNIAPGARFMMGANTSLDVGTRATSVKFVARGTEAMPIAFSGQVHARGSWGSIFLGPVTSDSGFDFVKIADGGSNDTKGGNLVVSKALALTHSSLSNSFGYGVVKPKSDPTDYTLGNSLAGNASGPVGTY